MFYLPRRHLRILALTILVGLVAACGSGAKTQSTGAVDVPSTPVLAAPANLLATSGDSQLSLTWSPSPGATGYHVKRGAASGGAYTQVAMPTMASFTDTSLVNGTTYFYVVTAVNAASESANSTEVSAVPAAPPTVPSAPTGLLANAGDARVSLQWSASSGATSYHVKRSATSGSGYTQIATANAAAYTDAPLTNGSTYYYVVSAMNAVGESADSAEVSARPAAPAAMVDVTISVNPAARHSISPYIYGLNFAGSVNNAPSSLTLDRSGGNRWTAYNWENNASNAGSDYLYENDAYLTSSVTPGAAVTDIIDYDQGHAMASLVTFQMQGLVAADVSGPVSTMNPPDGSRFKTVVFAKGSAFTATPSLSDPNVYMDEFIWAIDRKFSGQNLFGSAPAGPRVFAQLDNEPELWNSTHLEVQGSQRITSDAYIAKTISLSTALKRQFPSVMIFGPAHYGFFGVYAWNGELSPTAGGNDWFTDKYLSAIKNASVAFGAPLVDVYDFHWYPEATDSAGARIVGLIGPSLSDDQVQAIVQSPRSLWDSSYQENSWVSQALGGAIYMLPRLQSKISAKNPGMKLAITEYNNGGAKHIAGTIAQADNLGVFGVQALFAATMWTLQADENYSLAGFRAYRNFDGANHNFGDVSIAATSSNVGKVAVYVSTDTARPGRVVMVAINRSNADQLTAVNGQALVGTAHLFRMTATSAASQSTIVQPVAAGTQAVSGSSLTLSLPALSVSTIDIY